jgi:winged helix-turn-helix protein
VSVAYSFIGGYRRAWPRRRDCCDCTLARIGGWYGSVKKRNGTSPIIAWAIEAEFGVEYHPGHVRKWLHARGFSVQCPCRILACADVEVQDRWRRRIYPNLKNNPSAALSADLHRRSQRPAGLDPARHLEPRGLPSGSSGYRRAEEREDSRSHRTLAYGFDDRQDTAFNASTYLGFLEQLARRYRRQEAIMIQDNASYHTTAQSLLQHQSVPGEIERRFVQLNTSIQRIQEPRRKCETNRIGRTENQ